MFLAICYVEKTSSLETLDEDTIFALEADSFWCLSKLLEGIQDHYTFAQPGLQRMVFKLKELIHRHNGASCELFPVWFFVLCVCVVFFIRVGCTFFIVMRATQRRF